MPCARRVLTALIAAPGMKAVRGPLGWHLHQLTGGHVSTRSISVSGDWPLIFGIQQGEICDLDLEDCH